MLVPIHRQIGDLESIYTLNEVATFIWERLADAATPAALALALEDTFAGSPAEMRADLDEFLGHLLDLRAIRSVDDPSDGLDLTPSALIPALTPSRVEPGPSPPRGRRPER